MVHSLEKCIEDIKNSKSIAIMCHTVPDADALASMVALKKLIKQNFTDENSTKQIDLFVDADEISEINGAIIQGAELNTRHEENYDLAISVDCSSLSRLGKYAELFKSTKNNINIDHHATNEKFADNNLVFVTSSTCEALYRIAKIYNMEISDEVCKLVYSGIITDTNNLTQGTITVNTHKIITEMVQRKISLDALNEHFFKNNTKSKAYLLKQALDSLTFYAGDRIAFMKLTKQDISECDATVEDTYGIVNHGTEIKGVDIAILAIKQEDNSYQVSLRSKGDVTVSEIAVAMGGGGHDQVAAFHYEGLLADMKEKLFPLCREELEKHPVIEKEALFDNSDVSGENEQEK